MLLSSPAPGIRCAPHVQAARRQRRTRLRGETEARCTSLAPDGVTLTLCWRATWEVRASVFPGDRAAAGRRSLRRPGSVVSGCTFDQGIDTTTAVGRMFFQILGAIAEFEHALMSERTMDGLAAARARGRTGGQKPKLGPRQVKLARAMYEETGEDGKRRYTVQQIADEFGVTRPTVYRALENP
ncbi:MAG TPA: recombinase family protein [Trebonia sp.]|nr:recombinase family protein [Trebonia sp.]